MGTELDRDTLTSTAGTAQASRVALHDASRGQRDELLVLAGHDIRNAVGIFDSALTMSLDAPETAPSMQGMMRRAVHRLSILTRAMVDLDLLQRGLMPLTATTRSLASVIDPVTEGAAEAVATKAVTVEVAGCAGLEAVVDATLVERLVAALLEHALGNAPAESAMRIEARRCSPDRIELRVVHRGRAVSPETSAAYFSTLPLRFAREAAKRHGGDIAVESPAEDGLGLAFVVTLAG